MGTEGLLGFVKPLFWCMLVSNLALDQRFCNGAQGRVLHWHPEKVQARKALSASHPELLVRFAKDSLYNWPKTVCVCPSVRLSTFPLVHSSVGPLVRSSACPFVCPATYNTDTDSGYLYVEESSLSKSEMVPDIDHMDITARQETLVNVASLPVLLQVPLVPCYASPGFQNFPRLHRLPGIHMSLHV